MYIDGGDDPQDWLSSLIREGYRCASCPVGPDAKPELVRAYRETAERHDICIAEVGAWSNPIASEESERKSAREKCVKSLVLADEIGARCCVNIAGSRSDRWDGPDERNLHAETFEMIVESVRDIIDEARPTRTLYALECMPWIAPDSIESYEGLITAIDRKAFGVHFDPVNLIHTLPEYYQSAALVQRFVSAFGARIRSCHAKDTFLLPEYTLRFAEVRPGAGRLDYAAYIQSLDRVDPDIPLLIEHLDGPAEYRRAAAHIRETAERVGVSVR